MLLLAALLIPPATRAQGLASSATDSVHHGSITGFASLPWGATRAEVIKQWGAPDTTHLVKSLSSEALVYPNEAILGEQAAMGMLIHRTAGLIRGQYLVRYGGGADCKRVYVKYRNAVNEAFPALSPVERKTSVDKNSEVGFCTAFQLGRAEAWSRWSDSTTGAQVTLRLDGAEGVLRVSYESPVFDTLAYRARQNARKRRFGGVPPAAADSVDPASSDSAAVDSLLQLLKDTVEADSLQGAFP